MVHVEALREFNRFYTRRIDVLRHDYLGSPFALPEARLVFEIGRTPGISATTLGRELGDMARVMAVMVVIVVLGLGFERVLFGSLEKRLRERWGYAQAEAA